MQNNGNLNKAKAAKNDEFYTRLEDIEKELKHYTEHFKGKVVYCNCDDANRSNFFKYFSTNFQKLGLKKLITSGLKDNGTGVVAIQKGDDIDIYDGNGDFRSEECIEFLKEADIVVTNPPFSLFREYVAQLMQYGKKFLIIGNKNAITYKEIFPYIKNNELWLGRTLFTGKMPYFKVSEKYPIENERFEKWEDGLYKQVNSVCWFTNLENTSNKEELIAIRTYNPTEYPKYENYNAIEVGRMENFPMDYDGVCGVPITGLKYLWNDGTIHIKINGVSNQFEIIGQLNVGCFMDNNGWQGSNGKNMLLVNGKTVYKRILIQKIN